MGWGARGTSHRAGGGGGRGFGPRVHRRSTKSKFIIGFYTDLKCRFLYCQLEMSKSV